MVKPGQMVTQVEYKDRKAMERGVRQMTGKGFTVAATMELAQRRGALARLMWLPWLASKKPHYMVTYTVRTSGEVAGR